MISFRSSLLGLRKPSDVCDGVLAHLNIHIEQDVSLDSLVPQPDYGPRPFLFDSDLESMLKELDVDNEDAYRELQRLPPLEGKKKPRLAYARNFFAGLEDMRRYYDDSQDNYFELKVTGNEDEGKKSTSEKGEDDADSRMTYEDAGPPIKKSSTAPETAGETQNESSDTLSFPQTKALYKGLRLGNAMSVPRPNSHFDSPKPHQDGHS